MSNKDIFALYDELVKIRKLLELIAQDSLKRELRSICSTKERKMAWKLMDGTLKTEELAYKVKLSSRSIQRFVQELQEKGLVESLKRGYPKKKFKITI